MIELLANAAVLAILLGFVTKPIVTEPERKNRK